MGFWTLVRRGQRQIGKQSHPSDLPGGYFLPALAIPASLETTAHGEEEASWSESWFIFCLQGTCAQQHMVSVDLCTQMSEQGKQWANIILEAKASIHAAFAQKNQLGSIAGGFVYCHKAFTVAEIKLRRSFQALPFSSCRQCKLSLPVIPVHRHQLMPCAICSA